MLTPRGTSCSCMKYYTLTWLGMQRPQLPVTAISFKCRGNKDIQWRKTHEIGVTKMRIAAHDIFSYGWSSTQIVFLQEAARARGGRVDKFTLLHQIYPAACIWFVAVFNTPNKTSANLCWNSTRIWSVSDKSSWPLDAGVKLALSLCFP